MGNNVNLFIVRFVKISKGGGCGYSITETIAMNYTVLGGNWNTDQNTNNIVFTGLPIAYRATFFIDKKGYIRHLSINDLPLGRNIDELLRIIDMWQHVEKTGQLCPLSWNKGSKAITPSQEGMLAFLERK